LRVCETETDVIDEVAITVVHEIAHHFGIDDARLHELVAEGRASRISDAARRREPG
jgi:predicted Zn-dependent protease with MMP-like domain